MQRSAINERQLQRQFFLLSFFALHLFYRMVNHKCQHIKTENIKRGFEEGTADRKDYHPLSTENALTPAVEDDEFNGEQQQLKKAVTI